MLLRRLSSVARGMLVSLTLFGLMVTFVRETTPDRVPTNPVPTIRLTSQETDRAAAFPPIVGAVPAVVYHDISGRRGGDSVTPEAFAEQLAVLKAAGFAPVGLREVLDLVLGQPVDLPERPILITFDDATSTQYTDARNILRRYGFRAVSFVPTGQLADRTPSYNLTRDQLRQLVDAGWGVGSQTDTGRGMVRTGEETAGPWLTNRELHPDGTLQPVADWQSRLTRDLGRSADVVRGFDRLSPAALAYPVADGAPSNDQQLSALLRQQVKQRYDLAFTSASRGDRAISRYSDRWRLPRLTVTADMTPGALLDALTRMVPQPPTSQLGLWKPRAVGGSCVVDGQSLRLTGSGYVRCQGSINDESWRDYSLQVEVSGGGAGTTAMVGIRDQGDRRLEVAISRAHLVVRERCGGQGWRELGTVSVPWTAEATPHHLRIRVQGGAAVVSLDGRQVSDVSLDPGIDHGAPSFGMAANGTDAVVFSQIQVAPLPRRGSPS
ncbi:MAG TPA: polysaccharide deacetylase family protein [Kineosporiaceae bacterium]|nr:polysaccharide deacetylase family protein [Kineosporiaceae bacterium]